MIPPASLLRLQVTRLLGNVDQVSGCLLVTPCVHHIQPEGSKGKKKVGSALHWLFSSETNMICMNLTKNIAYVLLSGKKREIKRNSDDVQVTKAQGHKSTKAQKHKGTKA